MADEVRFSGVVEERLRKILAEQLGVGIEELVPEASFIDDLNADSLEMVDLIIALEEEFYLQIKDEDAERIKTVQDALDFLHTAIGDENVQAGLVLEADKPKKKVGTPAKAASPDAPTESEEAALLAEA